MHSDHAFGTHTAERLLGLCRVTVTAHEAHARTPTHDHPFPCLHWIIDGLYIEQDEESVVLAGRGSVLIKPRGAPHRNLLGTRRAVSLRIEHPALDAISLRSAARLQHDPAPGTRLASALASLANAVTEGAEFETVEAGVERVLDLLRAPAADRDGGEPPEVRAARMLTRTGFHAPTVAEVAAAVGVHRAHLARRFRARFGCSPKELQVRSRLARFASDLTRDHGSAGSLAIRAGFFDQSHCCRQFSQVFGGSPGEWAALARG